MFLYNKQIFQRCFHYPKKYWYKNIKYIPLYFKLINHLIEKGYDEYATWETFNWFIDVMKNILASYRKNHQGYPVPLAYDENEQEKFEKKYDADLDAMISLLDDMNECNPKYNTEKYNKNYKLKKEEMNNAKNKFFELFSKYFYTLWD